MPRSHNSQQKVETGTRLPLTTHTPMPSLLPYISLLQEHQYPWTIKFPSKWEIHQKAANWLESLSNQIYDSCSQFPPFIILNNHWHWSHVLYSLRPMASSLSCPTEGNAGFGNWWAPQLTAKSLFKSHLEMERSLFKCFSLKCFLHLLLTLWHHQNSWLVNLWPWVECTLNLNSKPLGLLDFLLQETKTCDSPRLVANHWRQSSAQNVLARFPLLYSMQDPAPVEPPVWSLTWRFQNSLSQRSVRAYLVALSCCVLFSPCTSWWVHMSGFTSLSPRVLIKMDRTPTPKS